MQIKYFGWIVLVLVVIAIGMSIARSWVAWRRETSLGRKRVWSGMSLIAVSMSLLAMCVLIVHADIVGGFGNNLRPVYLWCRMGFWFAIAAIVTSLLGRGHTQKIVIPASGALLLIWIAVAMST